MIPGHGRLPPPDEVLPSAHEAWERHLGADVGAAALRSSLTEGTVVSALDESAKRTPTHLAVVIDGVPATFGELRQATLAVAVALRERGLRDGDRVLLCGGNSLELVIAYLSVLRAGGVAVLANPHLTPPELEHLVSDSGAPIAFGEGEALAALRSIGTRMGRPSIHVALRGSGEALIVERLLAESATMELPAVASHSPALLAYTSGTTGTPKRVPLTHANLLASIRAAMLAWAWSARDVLVHALPLSHGHGLSGIHTSLIAGSTTVVHGRFDPGALVESMAERSATVLFAVPAIYQRLVAWRGIADADLSTLRLPISGSAPLSPSLAERIEETLGQLPLERYGTTESGLNVSNLYSGRRIPGAIGYPLPGVEVAVADPEGRIVGPGEDGEIVARGPQVFDGYQAAGSNEDVFFPHGWFRTGDVGRVDSDSGAMSVTGRAKEMIISGGLNVYPREVEIALETHPAVQAAAVVGVPSERWGEEVLAFVVPEEGGHPEPDALTAFLRERLAAYKCPKRIVLTEELPRNTLGKVVKADLVAAARGDVSQPE